WESLQRLLRHAYDTTDFYRQRFDSAGLHPDRLTDPAQLRALPVLTRDDIRNHLPAMTSRRYRAEDLRPSATGGTTDTPVKFLRDIEGVREKTAIQVRFNNWAGM